MIKKKKDLQDEVNRIVDIITQNYLPEKIILFGSLADGNIHEWSDIDLVIIKDTKERFIKRLHDVRLMVKPREGVDFIVYTPAEVEDMQKKGRRFFMKEILEKGRVIYDSRK